MHGCVCLMYWRIGREASVVGTFCAQGGNGPDLIGAYVGI